MTRTTDTVEFENGLYTAELSSLQETEGWQIGAIDPGILSDAQLEQLGEAVLASLAPVAAVDMAVSGCTDGRFRVGLADGSDSVPLSENLVGADSVTALIMAESLGKGFYGNDKATTYERIDEVVGFLADNGITACTHEGCGAAGGFVTVAQNIVAFSEHPNFVARQKMFVPVYEDRLYTKMVAGLGQRLGSGVFYDYSDAALTASVTKYGGDRTVARYRDDGRGIKGHCEAVIVRLVGFDGMALDVNQLASATGGAQVFSVNDNRIARLANLFGRGRDEDYATAYMAAEAFSDAGHGTLGRNLRTMIIRPSA